MMEREIKGVAITLYAYQEAEKSVIEIEDNGGGIEVSPIEKVFDPYFTTRDDNGGTGIGLYMAKVIIEKNMRGEISVSNTPKGARFKLEFEANV